ncbi:MAG: hypothetical protein RIT51_186 [Actinomycetota bacterium]
MQRPFRRVTIALAMATTMLFSGLTASSSWAVPDDYPTWAEVEAARNNVAQKKIVIAKLDKIIAEQTVQETALTQEAQLMAEKYNQAKTEVDAITAKVKILQGQAESANAQANQAKTQLGQIASQMYRQGAAGTSMNLLLNADEADDLLYKLGAQERVAQTSETLYQRSIQTQKYAESLNSQLKVAKGELAAKAAAAKSAYNAAQAVANKLTAAVNANKAQNAVFYAQLARLKNVSAETERLYQIGLAMEQAQNQGTTKPVAPELYDVGPADPAKVAKVIAFAKAQLGEWYVLGGMGPNVWDCSGLTKASYAAAGIYIGTHSATNQFREMARQRKLIPLSEAVPGDLMWYSPTTNIFDGDKEHVVIYLGDDYMIEAPRPGTQVRIVKLRLGRLFPYAGRPSA